MSNHECTVSKLLLQKYFGKIVSQVGEYLSKNGWQALASVTKNTKVIHVLVKKALCVLIQHKLVVFRTHKRRIEYKFLLENGLNLIHIPKIIYTAKLLYGDPGELLIEETLLNGTVNRSEVVKKVKMRLQESSEQAVTLEEMEKTFEALTNTRFLMKEEIEIDPQQNGEDSQADDGGDAEPGSKRKLSDADGPDSKRKRGENVEKEYYLINYPRFAQYFRDQVIVAGITHKFNSSCGDIVRTMLRISEVTTCAEAGITQPITSNEVMHSLPGNLVLPIEHIEQYMNIMMNDQDNYLQKSDESSNSTYVLNLKNCVFALCTANVLSYVQERFGSKCCRIFKLLLSKKHMEQKQVEDFAMIPSKEAKELLYSMLAENLLVMQEIPKTADHAPSRTFYLFAVNLPKVVRTLISRSYRMLINFLARQGHELQQNKRLLEKRERIDSIKANLQEVDPTQLEEIDEMLTAAERSHLTTLEHCCKKLGKGHIQISNTIFLLNLFLKYNLG